MVSWEWRKNICFAKVQKSTEKETRINIRNNTQNEQKTRRKKKWPKKVTTRSVIPKSPKFGRVFSQKTWKQIYECDSIENLWFLIFRVKNTKFQGKLTPSIIGFVLHDNHTATKINLPSQVTVRVRMWQLCKKVNRELHLKTCIEINSIADNHRPLWWWWWWWWPLCDAIDYRAIMLWHESHLTRWLQFSSIRFGVYVFCAMCA